MFNVFLTVCGVTHCIELFFWNISLPFLNLTFVGKYFYQGTQYNKFSSSLFCSFNGGNRAKFCTVVVSAGLWTKNVIVIVSSAVWIVVQ
jgi:hypothetical protein